MTSKAADKQTTLVQSVPASAIEDAELSFQFSKDEHNQGFWTAMRLHWPAVGWGLFMNLVRGFQQHLLPAHFAEGDRQLSLRESTGVW